MFIRYYTKKVIIVRNKSKKELEDRLVELNFPKYDNTYDYLTNMAIISLTTERAGKLEDKYKEMELKLKNLKEKTIEKMWIENIDKLTNTNKKYNLELLELVNDLAQEGLRIKNPIKKKGLKNRNKKNTKKN